MADPVSSALRSITLAAGIAPDVAKSLVSNRDQVIAALLRAPMDPRGAVPGILSPSLDGLGDRVVRMTCAIFGDDLLRAGIHGAVNQLDGVGESLSTIQNLIVEPIVNTAGGKDVSLRASLIAAQLGGLVAVRYVAKIEPLASAPEDVIVAWYGPIIQRLLDPATPLT
jgi:hypothetical protein